MTGTRPNSGRFQPILADVDQLGRNFGQLGTALGGFCTRSTTLGAWLTSVGPMRAKLGPDPTCRGQPRPELAPNVWSLRIVPFLHSFRSGADISCRSRAAHTPLKCSAATCSPMSANFGAKFCPICRLPPSVADGMINFGQISPEFGHSWPALGQDRPNTVQLWFASGQHARTRATRDRTWICDRICPTLGSTGPTRG